MDTSRTQDEQDMSATCIAACNECNRICLQHIEHCLSLGESHAEPAHIAMLLTCATVCRTATELMSINSEWHATVCDLCAQVCAECADQCEELGDMDDCVTACQNCADACRGMVGDQINGEHDDDDEDEEAELEHAANEALTNERLN